MLCSEARLSATTVWFCCEQESCSCVHKWNPVFSVIHSQRILPLFIYTNLTTFMLSLNFESKKKKIKLFRKFNIILTNTAL